MKAGPPRTEGRHGRPQGRRPRHLESIPYRHHRRARVGGLGLLKGGALRHLGLFVTPLLGRRSDPTPSATSWFASSNVSIRPTSSAMVPTSILSTAAVRGSPGEASDSPRQALGLRLHQCFYNRRGRTRTRLLGAHWNAVRDGRMHPSGTQRFGWAHGHDAVAIDRGDLTCGYRWFSEEVEERATSVGRGDDRVRVGAGLH